MTRLNPLQRLSRSFQSLPLHYVLVIPFLLQIFAAVGLVGYWSLRNGQKSVDTLVAQLQISVSREIDSHLRAYLQTPNFANQASIAAIELGFVDPSDPDSLTDYFRRVIADTPEINTIQYGALNGDYFGIGRWQGNNEVLKISTREMNGDFQTLRLNANGEPTYIYNTRANYVLQERDWFNDPKDADDTRWSPVYVMFSNRMLGLTLAEPVKDENGELLGIIGTDVLLAELNIFLKSLEVGKTGQAFILERNGALIGSSTLRSSLNFRNDQSRPERLLAEISEDNLIQSTTRHLQAKFGSLDNIDRIRKDRIELDGETHFLQVSPYRDEYGLDWLVILTIPESDFIAQIHVNTRNTILLMLVALVLASGIGLITSRWIAKPILQLSQAAIALSSGHWNVAIPNADGGRKLGMMQETNKLAMAFHRMRLELQQSFDQLEEAKAGLEIKVQERTKELRKSELKYRGLYDNSQVGIFRTDLENGLILDANARCKEMMGYDERDEFIGVVSARDFYVDISTRTDLLAQAINDEIHNFETQFRRKDGTLIDVLISGRYNHDDRCLEGVINDISDRKKIERALKVEQAKSDALLLNILPATIAAQLKEKPGAIAEQYDQATVLFADVVDFTPLASSLSPKALLDLLNQIFSAFDQLADRYNLEKIKTIGDAYMLAGGLPRRDPKHVKAIAEMALEMIAIAQEMSPLQIKLENGSILKQPFRLRIGMNTGEVIAGVIGKKKFIYDLWGDAVNVASRMESSGEPSLIQVTEMTYELLKDDFIFEKRGMISVKGKGAMTTYWLLGKKASTPLDIQGDRTEIKNV